MILGYLPLVAITVVCVLVMLCGIEGLGENWLKNDQTDLNLVNSSTG